MSDDHTPATVGVLEALEPVVARLLDRHLAAAKSWFPHAYVPWSEATDYDGPLDGEPWRRGQSLMSAAVQDSFTVSLLTEDNLPSYHHEIATVFGRDGAWGTWVHRWTAEEDRHAYALRSYLHARRALDPVHLEEQRMAHLSRGFDSGRPGVLHSLAYVTVQEMATREAHRNTGKACEDPLGEQLTARIAADENLHMLFYRDLFRAAIDLDPDAAVTALADVVCDFRMPGANLPGFQERSLRIAAAGIYNLDIHREHVLLPLLRTLGVWGRTDLTAVGDQARERVGLHLEQVQRNAARFRSVFARMSPDGVGGT
ncbi:acyl-ACP desaturase [Streptomyces sp. NPDC057148]|uniref:acyl-ACP desaturase n=1 Tax=unclassified Streptomyces TaxID=2593676 RepID=UPI00363D34C3